MSDILIIAGSPSASSKSGALFEHIRQQLAKESLTSRVVSVRDFPAEDLLHAKYDSPVFDEIKKLVENASGIIVTTPIYKASYTGALKALLDILPQTALRGKTVLPIANGGSPAHLLAIDYAIKPVLSALGATDLLQGVYIVEGQLKVDSDGVAVFTDELRARIDDSVARLAANVRPRAVPVSA